jgi:hypothetical protein
LYKETILHPDPRYITVRYRKRNGLSFPTYEKLKEVPPSFTGLNLMMVWVGLFDEDTDTYL